jgi:hypothetical protein
LLRLLFPPLQPSLKRGRTFRGLFAEQQSLNADIPVEIRPIDPVTCAAVLSVYVYMSWLTTIVRVKVEA